MDKAELQHFLADSPPVTVNLAVKPHFDALSDKAKQYAHYLTRASYVGTRITLRQTSPESEDIYDFIIELYKSTNGDWSALKQKAGINDEDLKYFLEYAAMFLGNGGNYKGFGDVKFLPRTDEKVFAALASAAGSKAEAHYKATNGAIFTTNNSGLMLLGYPDEGHVSPYYPDSPDITKAEITAINDFLGEIKLLPENTRLRKTTGGDFELLITSAVTDIPANGGDAGKETTFKLSKSPVEGRTLKLVYGDHSETIAKVAEFHRKAAEVSANENQKKMHIAYAESAETGSMEVFKDSQRYWIRDKSPAVETNIGFIETYRDPHGVRGEWQGWVATVNLERTRAFGGLVESAPKMIPKLPWSKDFEKDAFQSPDFTSLEVIAYGGSGIPAGINIPNFDDIRQTEGFKNVSLGNVLNATNPNQKFPFIAEKDVELFKKYTSPAFEVQVGIHELLGHGTGKLLQETSPGVFNFDHENPPISPVTGKPVTSWYKPQQTWGSVFGGLAPTYEECRAECVAMALACDFEILKIFGHGDGTPDMNSEAGDVLYISYLTMARAGIVSLEVWDPKSRKWGQAHSQARHAILRTFLEAGEDFCKLSYTRDDMQDLTIDLDRSKIPTVGRKAVESFLQKLHIYKSTADLEAGTKLFHSLTDVDEFWGTKVRNEVLRNKQPRKVFVTANTFIDADGNATLKEYEPTLEGMIQSFAERDV